MVTSSSWIPLSRRAYRVQAVQVIRIDIEVHFDHDNPPSQDIPAAYRELINARLGPLRGLVRQADAAEDAAPRQKRLIGFATTISYCPKLVSDNSGKDSIYDRPIHRNTQYSAFVILISRRFPDPDRL